LRQVFPEKLRDDVFRALHGDLGHQDRDLTSSLFKRSLALVNIAENYPPETWTHVYPDGSATKAITDGGAETADDRPVPMRLV